MKRIICLMLVIVMVIACIAGCTPKTNDNGGGGDNGGNSNTGNTTGGTGGGKPSTPPQIGVGTPDEKDWWKKIKYDETNLLFMMTKCSNNEELSSGCERYLAGEGAEVAGEAIDELVAQRNSAAYKNTKVKVTYEYYPDNADLYGFAKMYDVIETEVMSADSSTPDMYCNWMTDLLVASLKGCFANLYSKNYGAGDYQGNNHFNLANEGYMADLMGSLTLSTSKIYVVASDYFIDLIRAFFVVPVNVRLFDEIAEKMYPDVANPTIDTFLKEVKPCSCTNYDKSTRCTDACADGGWTYDRLIEFSQAIYQADGTSNTETINSRLGFALGQNGLPAAGLIYTSSVTIISKTWNKDEGKYDYAYPTENQGLYDLAAKLSSMMDIEGIFYVKPNDAQSLQFEGKKTPLLGIRNQFVNDKLLFGGIILVGSLEYQAYQDMKTTERGGFGVVPVPVYKAGDDYLTQIHVVGRAGAIRYNTQKFVQCSAFLHYQSCNSLAIKNDYYEYTLVHGAASGENGVEGNVEMLQYIRQNVRTSFDKLFEDAIGFMYADVDKDSVNNRYHALLADHGYQYANMASKYKELQPGKSDALKNLEQDYSKLPS